MWPALKLRRDKTWCLFNSQTTRLLNKHRLNMCVLPVFFHVGVARILFWLLACKRKHVTYIFHCNSQIWERKFISRSATSCAASPTSGTSKNSTNKAENVGERTRWKIFRVWSRCFGVAVAVNVWQLSLRCSSDPRTALTLLPPPRAPTRAAALTDVRRATRPRRWLDNRPRSYSSSTGNDQPITGRPWLLVTSDWLSSVRNSC